MKKLFIIASVFAFVLASCTSKPVVEDTDVTVTDSTVVDSTEVIPVTQDSVLAKPVDTLEVN